MQGEQNTRSARRSTTAFWAQFRAPSALPIRSLDMSCHVLSTSHTHRVLDLLEASQSPTFRAVMITCGTIVFFRRLVGHTVHTLHQVHLNLSKRAVDPSVMHRKYAHCATEEFIKIVKLLFWLFCSSKLSASCPHLAFSRCLTSCDLQTIVDPESEMPKSWVVLYDWIGLSSVTLQCWVGLTPPGTEPEAFTATFFNFTDSLSPPLLVLISKLNILRSDTSVFIPSGFWFLLKECFTYLIPNMFYHFKFGGQ